MRRRKKTRTKEKNLDPQVFPEGVKVFQVEFDYKYDIAVPGKPVNVRLPMRFDSFNMAIVLLERLQSSVVIDTARKSSNKPRSRTQTESTKRMPKNVSTLQISLGGTESLQYRLHRYTRIVTPSYRTKVAVRFFSTTTGQGEVTSNAMKYFNQFLKAYRVATGDPVTFVNEEENKELGVVTCSYSLLAPNTLDGNTPIDSAVKLLEESPTLRQGPVQCGLGSSDIDLAPKPYIRDRVIETVRLAVLPEQLGSDKELILEAMERAYRHHDYDMGIVLLNTAFEAAITLNIITALVFLGYDEESISNFFDDNPDLSHKRAKIDEVRREACLKYDLPVPASFRGSSEESLWNSSTYQKRHWVVHIVREKTTPIKRRDFEQALKHTQAAIKLLTVPAKDLKAARDSAPTA